MDCNVITVAIASDHGGYHLKQSVMRHLAENNIVYKDFGSFSDESCDYPDFAVPVSQAVAKGEYKYGILICGTGIGMSIAANKVNGIRAALCGDTFSARMTRMHNDANILCMGERVIGAGLADDITDIFISSEFIGGKHKQRIDKITEIK